MKVTEEVIETFNKMGNRWKYMICKINVEAGMIELHKKVASGSGKDFYNEFLTELPPNEGRYVFYDVDYITPEGGQQTEKPSKLMFMIWAPDGAPMKEKMLYVSSRDPLYKQLGLITTEDGKDSIASNTNGIQYEVQATDLDEAGYDAIYKKVHLNKPRATIRHK